MKNWIIHTIIGHIPYFVREENDTKFYRCTLCQETLHLGSYNRLYKETQVKL